ncbi:MAG: N-acetyl-alpha-D-glucosaminyl-diphospho-ditrans,octacis-undecaprenol 4-epimerase [Syntrophus sp. SKADARSKE-3]|nr:N-acetyl-alpha-D-glucosaminyl-diphospho-ditrans,octacis-undecaprenol 4-epimerase [Syntrophus sp. SKADARSKE-3]
MKDRPLVLVTGATGAVGPRVVKALCHAGYRLRTLSLDCLPREQWPAEIVDARIGDITDSGAVRQAMEDVWGVIHLAALLHIVNPDASLEDLYVKVNVQGTQKVVDEAVKAGVRRVLYFSTIAVYGETNGQIVDEGTPPRPNTFYSRSKLEAEKIVLSAKDANGNPVGTVLRMAAIYGSGIKGNYRQLLMAIAGRRFIPIGRGQNRRTLIYDKDVADAAVLALSHPASAGRLYNLSDGHYHRLDEILEAMYGALGRHKPSFYIPVGPVSFLAGVMEDATRAAGVSSPVRRASIDKYLEDIAVDSRLVRDELGFSPRFDLASGWADTVREMRQAGVL